MHVDGVFGGFVLLAPKPLDLAGGLKAGVSLALELHKWFHIPYASSLVQGRDDGLHSDTFVAVSPIPL